eukprot:Gb_11305 [translate_table: standard]
MMMRASRRSPANLNSFKCDGSPVKSGKRLNVSENKKSFNPSSPNARKDPPLSPLSLNAIDEEKRLVHRTRNLNIQQTNSRDDKDSSTDATCIYGQETSQIAQEDRVSPIARNVSRRVVWSNAVYGGESAIENENSIRKVKEEDAGAEYKEFSSPIASNHVIAVQENTADKNSSKENENWDVESTASTWYTPIATQGPTSDQKRATHIPNTEGNNMHFTKKALFCTGDSASQTVMDAKNSESAVEEEDVGGKSKSPVKNDKIDSGIEEIEKQISLLTQKLAELRLQKANSTCAKAQNLVGISQTVEVPHEVIQESTPRKTSIEVEMKNNSQEGSSEKKKRGRVVSAKFLSFESRTQLKSEQKLTETNSSRKSSGIQTSPRIQRRAVSLGSTMPQMRRIPSKINGVKGDNCEEQKDKINKKLEPQKTKDAIGEVCSSVRYDRKENESWNLSVSPISHQPIEKKLNFSSNLKSKEVSTSDKKLGRALSANSEGRKWLHENCKKLFEQSDNKTSHKVSCKNNFGGCRREQPNQVADKLYPALKNARIVPSRYGRVPTPNKDGSTKTQAPAKLSSQRNAHGKRISSEVEVEDMTSRLDSYSFKRPAVDGVANSPSVKNFTFRNGYPERSGLTPNSKTPQSSAARIEIKKIPSPCLKEAKSTWKPGRRVPGRHWTRATKQQPMGINQKGCSKRSLTITAERSLNKPSDPFPQNCTGGMISNKNEEKVPEICTNHCSSMVFPSLDSLEPERMKLPKISTFRFTAKSPRDSGCIKRAVHQSEKHPFFSSDEVESTILTDKRSGSSVSKASRVEIDEIRQILSFENETDMVDLQGFWHVVDAA